jgi:hypothetical protein
LRDQPYRMIDPCNPYSIQFAADRLEDLGRPAESHALRRSALTPDSWSGGGDGYGDGSGYGPFSGMGMGAAEGDGDGSGYGIGSGDGSGGGFRYEDGSRDGHEYELSKSLLNVQVITNRSMTVGECEPGRLYMVAIGLGWMFVGRFVRPTGMFGGVFADVKNICRTGGIPWDDLCRGHNRDRATFRTFDGEMTFPYVQFVVPWAEEGR